VGYGSGVGAICGELEALVENIRQTGFKTQDGSEMLMQYKKHILSHFLRLTRDYSPALTRASENHSTLDKTVRFFVADAKNVSREINDFFLRYPVHLNSLAFASDYGKIFGLLLHAVHKHNAVAGLLEHVEKQKNTANKAANN
jgi:hypothetical protein